MEILKDCLFSLCVTMVVGAVLYYLLPEGSLQQLFKVVFCVFFLCALCVPFLKTDFRDFSFSFQNDHSEKDREAITEKLNQTTKKQLEEEMKKRTEEILEKNGIDFREIMIKVNIGEDQSISITEFSVIVEEKEDSERMKNVLLKELGIEPELVVWEEKEDGIT